MYNENEYEYVIYYILNKVISQNLTHSHIECIIDHLRIYTGHIYFR